MATVPPLASLVAVAVVALSARVDLAVPGSPVPQSLQTLAVVLVGALMGPRRGTLAVLLYVVAGAVGLPVFADGASGPGQLLGPTGGYLAGFVAGAWVAGAWGAGPSAARRSVAGPSAAGARTRGWGEALLGMLLAHALILAMGWGRLALLIGAEAAWVQGVVPFLWGGVVKSAAALLVLMLVRRPPAALTAPAASG